MIAMKAGGIDVDSEDIDKEGEFGKAISDFIDEVNSIKLNIDELVSNQFEMEKIYKKVGNISETSKKQLQQSLYRKKLAPTLRLNIEKLAEKLGMGVEGLTESRNTLEDYWKGFRQITLNCLIPCGSIGNTAYMCKTCFRIVFKNRSLLNASPQMKEKLIKLSSMFEEKHKTTKRQLNHFFQILDISNDSESREGFLLPSIFLPGNNNDRRKHDCDTLEQQAWSSSAKYKYCQ